MNDPAYRDALDDPGRHRPAPPATAPVPHAFAAEYQRATGCHVEVTWRDAARQWIEGRYIEWLEMELKQARRKLTEREGPK